jgi:AraC-like DNA-binding protein
LRRCGIDPNLSAEGDERVSLMQFASLVTEALRITGDSGLGLEYGLRGRISHFGILGYALLSARDLRQAIEFLSRYYGIFDPVVRFEFEISPPFVCARAVESAALGRFEIFAHEATLACTASVARVLLQEPITPTRLTLCYPEPPHSQRYATVFGCRPEFDAPYTSIQFESRHLDAPLRFSNQEMAEICRQQCERWVRTVKEPGGLIFKVKEELLKTAGRFPKMETIAGALGMSVRSLRRHLSEKGVTYQELLDQVRRDLALDYLSNSLLTVEQIAELVGYGEAASFRKAFRRWTGKAPGECRVGSVETN